MNLPSNGGKFVQEYGGDRRINWDCPPVNMCHLIGAKDVQGNEILDYKYALDVVANYILDFLTKTKDPDVWSMDEHLANFYAFTGAINGKKKIGANIRYCSIGTASVTIPDGDNSNSIEGWVKELTEKSNPLFNFDLSIWQESQTTRMTFLSVPEGYASIIEEELAHKGYLWKVKKSTSTNKIIAIQTICGFPLSSYREFKSYEQKYFSSKNVYGGHLYEGKPIERAKFTDWRKLPSLKSQSVTNREEILSDNLREEFSRLDDLYNKAVKLRVINLDGQICKPSEETCVEFQELFTETKKILQQLESIDKSKLSVKHFIQEIELLNSYLVKVQNLEIAMSPTEYKLPQDGLREREEDVENIQKDYFYSFPVYQIIVKEILDSIEKLVNHKEKLLNQLENELNN
ncbi:hypothetical protein P261_00369 [Lachnospiraceae bacterium TWA4]|nr:hypothetical protein P261_00369 [Lachnospiraceae bacterium TWA4]